MGKRRTQILARSHALAGRRVFSMAHRVARSRSHSTPNDTRASSAHSSARFALEKRRALRCVALRFTLAMPLTASLQVYPLALLTCDNSGVAGAGCISRGCC